MTAEHKAALMSSSVLHALQDSSHDMKCTRCAFGCIDKRASLASK